MTNTTRAEIARSVAINRLAEITTAREAAINAALAQLYPLNLSEGVMTDIRDYIGDAIDHAASSVFRDEFQSLVQTIHNPDADIAGEYADRRRKDGDLFQRK